MSVGYRRDPRPGSTTRSESEAVRLANLVAASGRIRHQEGNIRFLDDRIRAAVQLAGNIQQRQQRAAEQERAQDHQERQIRQTAHQSQNQNQDRITTSPVPASPSDLAGRSSWANLLLFGLNIMLNERMRELELGGYVGSSGRVLRVLDDLLVLLLDPAFEDVVGSTGSGSAYERVTIPAGAVSPAAAGGSGPAVNGVNGNEPEHMIRGRGRGEGQDQNHRRSWERNLEQADGLGTVSLAGASEAA